MLTTKATEIDHHTIKLIVGVIALTLASLTSFFAGSDIQSISASYHEGGWARDIFVGFLFAIAAFLLAYNGRSPVEWLLGKFAAFAALGVALFPCSCGAHAEVIPYVHGVSATFMFITLAIFCYLFYQRARSKGHLQARLRALIYAICGCAIVASIAVIAADHLLGGILSARVSRLFFIGEATALIAFGIAWLTASRTLPIITSRAERLPLSPFMPAGEHNK